MAGAGLAEAGPVDTVRLGVAQHNICTFDCDNADKEDGPDIHGQVNFQSPQLLHFAGSPQPYLAASVNTQGNTSFATVGLQWQLALGEHWVIEPGFGYGAHDGALVSPFPQGDPRSDAYTKENVLFGSRDLFRSSLVLGRDVGERWGLEVLWEHYSHGQISRLGTQSGHGQYRRARALRV